MRHQDRRQRYSVGNRPQSCSPFERSDSSIRDRTTRRVDRLAQYPIASACADLLSAASTTAVPAGAVKPASAVPRDRPSAADSATPRDHQNDAGPQDLLGRHGAHLPCASGTSQPPSHRLLHGDVVQLCLATGEGEDRQGLNETSAATDACRDEWCCAGGEDGRVKRSAHAAPRGTYRVYRVRRRQHREFWLQTGRPGASAELRHISPMNHECTGRRDQHPLDQRVSGPGHRAHHTNKLQIKQHAGNSRQTYLEINTNRGLQYDASVIQRKVASWERTESVVVRPATKYMGVLHVTPLPAACDFVLREAV